MRKKKVKETADLKRFAEEVINKINSHIQGLEDEAYTSPVIIAKVIIAKQIRDYELLIMEINDLLRKYENNGKDIL